MTNAERFEKIMAFEPVDRIPAIESFPYWDKTLERWYNEGLPRELTDAYEIGRWFGLDMHRWWWISPRWNIPPRPGRMRNEGMADGPEEYEKLVKPALQHPNFHNPPFYTEEALHEFAEQREKGDIFLWLQIDGFFWFPRECMGITKHLYAFYDQIDYMHQINNDLADYTEKMLTRLFTILVPDIIVFAEDMSYNGGPMISKNAYNDFISPYYARIVPLITEHGSIPMVDSDGVLEEMIPWLQEDGIDGTSPMERQAGTDIEQVRRVHPKFKMMGGFDKRTIHQGEEAMRAEFERILPVMRSGGYIPSVDHQTPPDVSLEKYKLYASLLNEYCRRV